MELTGQKRRLSGCPASFWGSLLAGLWTIIRGVVYQARIVPKRALPIDLPFMTLSPVAAEYNIALTLFLVTLLGIVAAAALFAHKGKWRYWAVGTFIFNILAYWYSLRLVEWAISPPPGVDY